MAKRGSGGIVGCGNVSVQMKTTRILCVTNYLLQMLG